MSDAHNAITRRCKCCEQDKPITNFSGKGGKYRSHTCNPCTFQRRKSNPAWFENYKKRRRASEKRTRQTYKGRKKRAHINARYYEKKVKTDPVKYTSALIKSAIYASKSENKIRRNKNQNKLNQLKTEFKRFEERIQEEEAGTLGKKHCAKCNIWKPFADFAIKKNGDLLLRSGYSKHCLACHNRNLPLRCYPVPPVNRVCAKCKIEKPIEQFRKNKGQLSESRCAICKNCESVTQRKRRSGIEPIAPPQPTIPTTKPIRPWDVGKVSP